jgi:DNA primase
MTKLAKEDRSGSDEKRTEKRDAVYSALLNVLDLTKKHRRALIARGLTDEEVTAIGYKTYPNRRWDLAERLTKKHDLAGVPGFWRNGKGWDIAGKPGIAIPVRARDGKITGLKIRVDRPVRTRASP